MSSYRVCNKCGIEVPATVDFEIGDICGIEENCPECNGEGGFKDDGSFCSGKIKCDGHLIRINTGDEDDQRENENEETE